MFKLIRTLLALAHLISKREELRQQERQRKFKRAAAERYKELREQESRARAKADALGSRAAYANAAAAIGCNEINEAERVAASTRCALDWIVKK